MLSASCMLNMPDSSVRTSTRYIRELFLHDLGSLSWWRAWLINLLRFFVELFSQFNRDNCVVRSAGLSYTSLLAMVPLMVVAFSIFTSFSAFANLEYQIKTFITDALIPSGAIETDTIRENLDMFAAKARTVRYVGMIAFFLTSILFFNTIETALNSVWKVVKRRSIMGKFFSFTALIVWGPLLIGLSMMLTARIKILLAVDTVARFPVLQSVGLMISQYALTIAALTITYLVVPHTKVKLKSALLGGVVAGILWDVAKQGFTYYISNLVSINKIYGSLSVLPIFLIWLYLTWLIVLLGAEVSYVHQNFRALMIHRVNKEGISARHRAKLAVTIFYYIALHFFRGDHPPNTDELVKRSDLPLETVDEIIGILESAELLAQINERDPAFLPSKSISRINISDVVSAVYEYPPESVPINASIELGDLEPAIDVLIKPETNGDMSFAELIEHRGRTESDSE